MRAVWCLRVCGRCREAKSERVMATLSMIVPTYNRQDYLGEALDSALAQALDHWDCIVVDDVSRTWFRVCPKTIAFD
jgi:GT2 family glycosyltransferase